LLFLAFWFFLFNIVSSCFFILDFIDFILNVLFFRLILTILIYLLLFLVLFNFFDFIYWLINFRLIRLEFRFRLFYGLWSKSWEAISSMGIALRGWRSLLNRCLLLRFFLLFFMMFGWWLFSCLLRSCSGLCFLFGLLSGLLFDLSRLSRWSGGFDRGLALLANDFLYFLRVSSGSFSLLFLLLILESPHFSSVVFLGSIGFHLESLLLVSGKNLPLFSHSLQGG
jgi:hypothetical protein